MLLFLKIFSLLLLGAGLLQYANAQNSMTITLDTAKSVQYIRSDVSSVLRSALQTDISDIQKAISTIEKLKNEYKISNFRASSKLLGTNIYWIAGSIVAGYFLDKAIERIQQESQSHQIQLPSCQNQCVRSVCVPGDCDFAWQTPIGKVDCTNASKIYVCSPVVSCYENALSIDYYNCRETDCRDYYTVRGVPVDVPPFEIADACPQTSSSSPAWKKTPFVIPLTSLDDAINKSNPLQDLSLSNTISENFQLPDTVKTVSDVAKNLPDTLSSSTNFSSNPPFPSPYRDVSLGDSMKVNITINSNTYNEYNTVNNNTVNNSSSSQNSDTYTPTDKQLDTSIQNPEKKSLTQLIANFLSNNPISHVFQIKNTPSGQCSFQIPTPFANSAVMDFCRFQAVFNMIGSVIIVFAYIYSIYIIFKKE